MTLQNVNLDNLESLVVKQFDINNYSWIHQCKKLRRLTIVSWGDNGIEKNVQHYNQEQSFFGIY